jgi:hypothetical protein
VLEWPSEEMLEKVLEAALAETFDTADAEGEDILEG